MSLLEHDDSASVMDTSLPETGSDSGIRLGQLRNTFENMVLEGIQAEVCNYLIRNQNVLFDEPLDVETARQLEHYVHDTVAAVYETLKEGENIDRMKKNGYIDLMAIAEAVDMHVQKSIESVQVEDDENTMDRHLVA